MMGQASRAVLRGVMRQVGRVPITRKALHRLSVASRGAGIAFLRCRRVLPNTALGKGHADRKRGSALLQSELDKEIRAAKRSLRFVHIAEALSALESGERLREGMAVLTFDESFAATAELALPVCRKHGVPFTVFVTTGHLESPTTLWDEEVRLAIDNLAPAPLSLSFIDRVLRTDSRGRRDAASRRVLLGLASLDEDRLQRRLEELFALSGGRPLPPALDRMLSTAELAALSRDPLVTFGAHGHRHLALSVASDAAVEDELVRPRGLLKDICGDAFVDVVSYPFGRGPYVDDRAYLAARIAGYKAGFTAEPGVARPGDHVFRLPRLPMGKMGSGVAAYELQGTFEALDEVLVAAQGGQALDLLDG
jgi:peptidoglycan/xylan/chitin deacetylase (PgdA/CDA1 family)